MWPRPVVTMEDCAWHIRGIRSTHLGPPHVGGQWPIAEYVYKGYTVCGLPMDLRWVPGEFGGGTFRPDKVCADCLHEWQASALYS